MRFNSLTRTLMAVCGLCLSTFSLASSYELIDERVQALKPSTLKTQLLACLQEPDMLSSHPFSIGHRGAPLVYPEHSKEGYIAAKEMGAASLECDVTFTKDNALVCRHSQCDLHTTTDILTTDFANQCSVPFQAANNGRDARAECCTSDINLSQFLTLKAKKDTYNPKAKTAQEYLAQGEQPLWGTVMTHQQSIALFQELDVNMVPELKEPKVRMPFNAFSQDQYRARIVQEYRDAGVAPERVWLQSFHRNDIEYWLANAPEFAANLVYLDGRENGLSFNHRKPKTFARSLQALRDKGVQYLAPPLWMLIDTEGHRIVPSAYAKTAKELGFELIAWSSERSGNLSSGGGWYYQSVSDLITNQGDIFVVLDVLAQQVGVNAVFSDYPASTSFYANCMLN